MLGSSGCYILRTKHSLSAMCEAWLLLPSQLGAVDTSPLQLEFMHSGGFLLLEQFQNVCLEVDKHPEKS